MEGILCEVSYTTHKMLYYLTVDLIKLFDCRFDCRFVGSVQFSSILQSCLTLWTP